MVRKLSRIFPLISLVLAFSAGPAFAGSVEDASFHLEAGYRLDELDWNIGGGASGPNIISELKWEDLEIYQIGTGGKVLIGNGVAPFAICLKGSVAYGWIVDGENQDSDYAGDNRTLEFSRSNNKADDGNVFDVSAGAGPQFRLRDVLAFVPMVGYSYHEQNLTMTDGFQTLSRPGIDPFVPPIGPFEGLDSTYETRWRGLWAGFDVEFMPLKRSSLFASFEYHWAEFEAEAQWNLRATGPDPLAQPKSFEHGADGEGIVLTLGGKYDLTDDWSVHLDFDYRDWEAEDGVIRFFPASGGVNIQPLNEVNWESRAVMLGMTYRFF